jgi:hypothetical protein
MDFSIVLHLILFHSYAFKFFNNIFNLALVQIVMYKINEVIWCAI